MINVARVGVNHLLTSRYGPAGAQSGIPAQYGIQGIPQQTENGGLPQITFSGLSTLGSNAYLPSNEVSDTLQITDDFTKTYGQHSFKMGIEFQNVKFSTLQPAYSRGNFDYGNNSSSISYTDIPSVGGGATGRATIPVDSIKRPPWPTEIELCGRRRPSSGLEHQQDLRREEVFRGILPG